MFCFLLACHGTFTRIIQNPNATSGKKNFVDHTTVIGHSKYPWVGTLYLMGCHRMSCQLDNPPLRLAFINISDFNCHPNLSYHGHSTHAESFGKKNVAYCLIPKLVNYIFCCGSISLRELAESPNYPESQQLHNQGQFMLVMLVYHFATLYISLLFGVGFGFPNHRPYESRWTAAPFSRNCSSGCGRPSNVLRCGCQRLQGKRSCSRKTCHGCRFPLDSRYELEKKHAK